MYISWFVVTVPRFEVFQSSQKDKFGVGSQLCKYVACFSSDNVVMGLHRLENARLLFVNDSIRLYFISFGRPDFM